MYVHIPTRGVRGPAGTAGLAPGRTVPTLSTGLPKAHSIDVAGQRRARFAEVGQVQGRGRPLPVSRRHSTAHGAMRSPARCATETAP